MIPALAGINFSSRAFGQGLAAGAALFFLLGVWAMLNADKTEKTLLERLASETVPVEWHAAATAAEAAGPHRAIPPGEYEAPPAQVPMLESGLAQAPVDGLLEVTPLGNAPVVRTSDGLTPFKAYRRPFDLYASDQPLISIAIADLGLSDVSTEAAVRGMAPEISFIMSPYAESPDFWIQESRARGHEVWLTLPVESKSYPENDPGPHTMLIGAPERENLMKLDWLLTRGTGYIGFVTSYEPEFMNSVNDMRPVIGHIFGRGLAFVDGSAQPGGTPQTMASGMKSPYSVVDVWLDATDPSQQAIEAALAQLETTAREKGVAVGVIHPLPVSFQQVQRWVDSLPDKGLRLAPLSATTGF